MTAVKAGRVNQGRVLQALHDLGPLSRADLARLTGVSRATIGSIVQPLLEGGLLVEGEPQRGAAPGGKPARPLWFAPDSPPLAAVHLVPGWVEAALVRADGGILAVASGRFRATAPAATVVDCVVDQLNAVLAGSTARALGVGIAVGGIVESTSGTIVACNLMPELSGLPLGPLVSERIGLPVHLDLHPRAQAIGDRWSGPGRGEQSFASIYIGEAIGAGLFLNGAIHCGPAGAGGEVGHTVVDIRGRTCRCGQRGCWETVATRDWLREEAARLRLPAARAMTTALLAGLSAAGDADARELFERYAHNIALGVVNLQQILAPGLFILHGDVTAGGEALRGRVERQARSRLPARSAAGPQITFGPAHDRTTLLGAAGLVLSRSFPLVG
ncbi:ROK family transcriptional regulator [Streptosporangium sp. NPDC000239]|uniref:ROK family transcriptional regulator n=1 Tax=Streptosporangium jomthongense TaxID=1193683 RepID=A0ABV8EU54_9ACTN